MGKVIGIVPTIEGVLRPLGVSVEVSQRSHGLGHKSPVPAAFRFVRSTAMTAHHKLGFGNVLASLHGHIFRKSSASPTASRLFV